MRRSTQVAAPLLALAASAMLSGCRKPDMRRCVDEHNVVVNESFCEGQPGTAQQRPDGHGGFIPFFPFRYYYGGYGGFGLGSMAGGGGYIPSAGRSYANSSGARVGTARGGFGSSFSSSGAHGGGGGGE